MSKKLIFVKLGGSIVTDKSKPFTLRQDVVTRLATEITHAYQDLPTDTKLIIGHGQGSFAHVPAKQYQTRQGFIDSQSPYGMTVVLDAVASINELITHQFIKLTLPVIPFRMANTIITQQAKPLHFFQPLFEQMINSQLIPLTCGDVIFDTAQGCTIWSTEEIFNFLIEQAIQLGHTVSQVIYVSDVDGFIDSQQRLVPFINQENWAEHKRALFQNNPFDVTGGMEHKVDKALELSRDHQITSLIINGFTPDNLYHALVGQSFVGTTIT